MKEHALLKLNLYHGGTILPFLDNLTEYLLKLEEELPSVVSSSDLLALGFVRSASTLSKWRVTGDGPRFFKVSEGVYRYLKADVITWIHSMYTEKSKTQNQNKLPLDRRTPTCQ